METGRTITECLRTLNTHRTLVIPSLVYLIAAFIIIGGFLQLSGGLSILHSIQQATDAYTNTPALQANYSTVSDYVGNTMSTQTMEKIFSLRTLWLALTAFALLVLVGVTQGAVSYSSAHDALHGKLRWKDALRQAAKRFGSYFSFRLSLLGLGLAPLILVAAVLLAFTLLTQNVLGMALMAFLLLIGYLAYLFFLQLRFIFGGPGVFWGGHRGIPSLKASYRLTRKDLLGAFIVLVIVAVAAFVQGQVQGSARGLFLSLLMTAQPSVLLGAILVVILVLVAAVDAFQYLFLLVSYRDFPR